MIIALLGSAETPDKSILAVNLAAQCANAGRQVLLVDTDPRELSLHWQDQRAAAGLRPGIAAYAFNGMGLQLELERLKLRFQDFIIDCAGADSQADRAALIAARLVIIPIQPALFTAEEASQLVERIACARLFNPALRVLLVDVGSGSQPADAMRAMAARLRSALLYPATLSLQASVMQAFEQGRSLAENPDAGREPVAAFDAFAREAMDYANAKSISHRDCTLPIARTTKPSPHYL
jgi:chromosome partitioning protein